MPARTIAIDLDDTINDFTATLHGSALTREPGEMLSEETFETYLQRVRGLDPYPGELLSTEYTFFRARIHLRCYSLARPRPDAVALIQRLHREGWRIVICTLRDLRRSQQITRDWLSAHEIPFDHLFMAGNKIVFCRLWEIPILIDDDVFNIVHGNTYGVQVYYPEMPKHRGVAAAGARAFAVFDEIYPWIHASS